MASRLDSPKVHAKLASTAGGQGHGSKERRMHNFMIVTFHTRKNERELAMRSSRNAESAGDTASSTLVFAQIRGRLVHLLILDEDIVGPLLHQPFSFLLGLIQRDDRSI